MEGPEGDTIDPATREELLERIRRKTATIGEQIPDSVEIDGEPFPLREFVWETKRQGHVPPNRREEVQTVRGHLVEKRTELVTRLEEAPITEPEGERLASTIIGIDRAITALKNLYETDLSERSHEEYVEGTRRWMDFIDRLTE